MVKKYITDPLLEKRIINYDKWLSKGQISVSSKAKKHLLILHDILQYFCYFTINIKNVCNFKEMRLYLNTLHL